LEEGVSGVTHHGSVLGSGTAVFCCTVAQGHCDVVIRKPQTSRMVQGLADAFKH